MFNLYVSPGAAKMVLQRKAAASLKRGKPHCRISRPELPKLALAAWAEALAGSWLILLAVFFLRLSAAASDCSGTSTGFVPLNDLGSGAYKGHAGGLYPSGSNSRPAAHESAGLEAARSISTLNGNGSPDAKGQIVLLSIGMSNTTREFRKFISLANADPEKNPHLVFVDGAVGGMTAQRISDLSTPDAQRYWDFVGVRLSDAGVTPAQVEVAWIKQAAPQRKGDFIDHAGRLKKHLALIVQILRVRFPNIRLVYLSSRIYGGYASVPLNPEPFAYESGFGVKWLIEDQIGGTPSLNFDPSKGEVMAPWLAWGPYLWADGLTPRSDGLTYDCSDFVKDGTHPSPGAQMKVAKMLLEFFKSDTTTRSWFLRKRGE